MPSGISPGFPELSPSRGQVSYVLLTRSPLYSPRPPEGVWDFLARLACIRRAASVHPEPGSYSLEVSQGRVEPARGQPQRLE